MNKTLVISLIVVVLFIGLLLFYQDKLSQNTSNQNAVAIVIAKKAGTLTYLADSEGRTLYTFDDDKDMESTCFGNCLKQWPIFEYGNIQSDSLDPLSQKINIVKRKDGFYQYAYGGKPLYYYVGDNNLWDKNGDNAEGKWHMVWFPN